MLNPLETKALDELDQIAVRFIDKGKIYQKQGDLDKAITSYRNAYELHPQDTELESLIKTLEDR